MQNVRPSRSKLKDFDVQNAMGEDKKQSDRARATRETIESIVVAVILAFLFRSFVAEAFVIPTGSMAPTLQGRHKDVECPQCAHRYRASASGADRGGEEVADVTCPMCRYLMVLDSTGDLNQFTTFNGDRILVSKFTYALSAPERWDVIVFKFPGNAKQNYIKRLVGLPGEYVVIHHGDIYTRPLDDPTAKLRIARKPEHKLAAMLQLVSDTNHIASAAKKLQWFSPYRPWSSTNGFQETSWKVIDGGSSYTTEGTAAEDTFVRFQMRPLPWGRLKRILDGHDPEAVDELSDDVLKLARESLAMRADEFPPQPVTDFYAYNFYNAVLRQKRGDRSHLYNRQNAVARGAHWIGDLAIEVHAHVKNNQGELLLDLVEGGRHLQCRIDVSSGKATLAIDGGRHKLGEDNKYHDQAVSQTPVKGPGRYIIRMSNVDNEVMLWVNDRRMKFDLSTRYEADNLVPKWTSQDPLDMAPAGVGSRGATLTVERLRLFRDKYYISSTNRDQDADYDNSAGVVSAEKRLRDYKNWDTKDFQVWDREGQTTNKSLFELRLDSEFAVPSDAYFPLGDNSPQSQDARLWSNTTRAPPYVKEELMIGKAMVIYWPHAWKTKFKIGYPNFERMGFIR